MKHQFQHLDRFLAGSFEPYISGICSADNGDDDGGGGGAVLSGDQVTAINTLVHKAITKRLDSQSFKDSIGDIAGEAASDAVSQATSSIVEQVTQAVGRRGGSDTDGDDSSKGGADWTKTPEYQEMIKRDKARDEEMRRIRQEREQEVEAKKRREERDVLSAALRKGGVEEPRVRAAVSVLMNEDRVIKRDKEGAIIWEAQREGYTDNLSVEAGVAEYLKSDEGKALLPATGARGTGAKPAQRGQKNSAPAGKMSKDEAAATLNEWLGGGGQV